MQAEQETAHRAATAGNEAAPLDMTPAVPAQEVPLDALHVAPVQHAPPEASPVAPTQGAPLEAVRVVTAPVKKSWREQRWERRRRRIWLEEVLGWILVPIIVIGSYWLVTLVLQALGTDISTILAGINNIISGRAAP